MKLRFYNIHSSKIQQIDFFPICALCYIVDFKTTAHCGVDIAINLDIKLAIVIKKERTWQLL